MDWRRKFANKLERKAWRSLNVGGKWTQGLKLWLWLKSAQRAGMIGANEVDQPRTGQV